MRPSLWPTLLVLMPFTVHAALGGPDSSGVSFVDSNELDGPPWAWFDTSGGSVHALDPDGAELVVLPFSLGWYGSSYDSAWIGMDGALTLEGAPGSPACPATGGTWAGVAPFWDDLEGGTVSSATFGQYPWRAFVVSWERASHATWGDDATLQLWLLERNSEAVIALQDITFGSAAADGGASAVVGVQGASGDGLAWSCTGGLSDGSLAWFYAAGSRPAGAEIPTDTMPYAWTGASDWAGAGRALAGGDLNGDGRSDLLISTEASSSGAVWVLYGATPSGALDDVALSLTGADSGDEAGTALACADLDGDGLDEALIGAPGEDSAGYNAGCVYVLLGPDLVDSPALAADADGIVLGPSGTGRAQAGSALWVPGDVDGDGLPEVLVGAPSDDVGATNAGTVLLFSGPELTGGTVLASDALASFWGGVANEGLGDALAGGDLDGDGLAEIVLGAPDSDLAIANAGAVYVLAGGSWSGGYAVASAAGLILTGEVAYDEAGSAMTIADLDGSGLSDLAVGAPRVDSAGTDAGAVYLLLDPDITAGSISLAAADTRLLGRSSRGLLGSALASGDLDADGRADLMVAAPLETRSGLTSGGVVYAFTSPPGTGDIDVSEAAHALLGSLVSATAGAALAFLPDWDSDGFGDLALGAPLGSTVGGTGSGLVSLWSWFPSFQDADGDGFVSIEAGAMDCDDDDPAVSPVAAEVAGNLVDDDCDGWVDDSFRPRWVDEHWEHDLEEEWGDPAVALFDFEIATIGADVSELYGGYGVHFSATSPMLAAAELDGALPAGTLGAALGASGASELAITFDEPVDALSLRLLDAACTFSVEAASLGSTTFTGWSVQGTSDDVRGGSFLGLEFAESTDSLIFTCGGGDLWGFDDVQVVWSTLTDADGDGYTEAEGDCDDSDPSVSPDATEVWGNGDDDDCDGTVDAGGADAYDDTGTWSAEAGLDENLVDFEVPPPGALASDAYAAYGLTFSAGIEVVTDVDGAAPRDAQAGLVPGTTGYDTLTLTFDEDQPALGLWLLDGQADFSWEASLDGVVLYSGTVSLPGDDLAGGAFFGLIFDVPVDQLTITAGAYSDRFGLDDLVFSTLGLDDGDGDGLTEREGDCDDTDASVHPGAEEVWYDGVDQDCDGGSDSDADGDGWDFGEDCDDDDGAVNPDATETWYDGIDQDCDGWSDFDADGDGFDLDRDCDDDDETVNPDAPETYYDGVDQNCVESDEYDADGDGYSAVDGGVLGPMGGGDCDDGDSAVSPGAEEIWYDGLDQDCDGTSDYDQDADGWEDDVYGGDDCDDTDPDVNPGTGADPCYDGIDQDCDGWDDYDCDQDGWRSATWAGPSGDCDDDDPDVHPGATEILGDGIDQDCDGWSDYDGDHDGWLGADFGGPDCDDSDPTVSPDGLEVCGDGLDQDCDGYDDRDCDGDGYDDIARGGADCDDGDPTIGPDALDPCYDGLDQDCDGRSDDDCDRDGHDAASAGGDDCDDTDGAVYPGALDHPYDGVDQDCDGADDYDLDGDGWTVDYYGGGDCDDLDADVHPGAPDSCWDGLDADCRGDDDYDCDGDGHRHSAWGGDDCDDGDAGVYPGAAEVCGDGVDQDCDGSDTCTDADGDGHADAAVGGDDCDDADPAVHPGAEDPCYDGMDQDCSGNAEDDCDGDGFAADSLGGDDCDDRDPSVNPGMHETWYDGVDADCDGADDYDQDGDGWRAPAWGGEDCDDADADRNPGVALDDCGRGDEDCDGETDEDCHPWRDTGDTGAEDTGELDTGAPPDDSGDSGPLEDTGAEDSAPWTAADDTGSPHPPQGCGCASGRAVGVGWVLVLLAPLAAALRRRSF